MTITVSIESPRQPAVIGLLETSDIHANFLYPEASNHLLDLDALEGLNVTFFVARRDQEIVGCCALIESGDGSGEIKRMFVDPSARGLEIGKRLMDTLYIRSVELGLMTYRLETGIKQPETINLYRGCGFREIGPFGGCKADPLSVFMEKSLS